MLFRTSALTAAIAVISYKITPAFATNQTSSSVSSRWGHASTYLSSPPTLIIHGGKTDPSSQYTYSSAPNTASTLILSLNTSFSTSSPPFTELDSTAGPSTAWHTISPVSQSGTTWQLLSFGGDGSTSEASTTSNDSVWLLTVDTPPYSIDFAHQAVNWGEQPVNKIYHSAATASDGKVFITGGLKDDGSDVTFSDVFQFDPSTALFTVLESLPLGIYHHCSVLLSNGTLVVLGGVFTSEATSNAELYSYSTIYLLDTTSSNSSWEQIQVPGTAPGGRRGANAVLSDDGGKIIIFGGANAGLGDIYGDVWALDIESLEWEELTITGSGAGARYDCSAVSVGDGQIVIFGGYASTGPADAGLYLYDSTTSAWATYFSAISTDSSSSDSGSDSSSSALESESTAIDNLTANPGGNGGLSATTTVGTASSGSDQDARPSSVFSITGSQTYTDTVPTETSATTDTGDAGANTHPLTTSMIAALIAASVAIAALALTICLCVMRRRNRRRRDRDTWPAMGPRSRIPSAARPYGTREKGGTGLLEDVDGLKARPASTALSNQASDQRPTATAWGSAWHSGSSIIGAGVASISDRIKTGNWGPEPYSELYNRSPEDALEGAVAPIRKPTRRAGEGIRLLGPRPQRGKSVYYAPSKPAKASSILRGARVDMLEDEDTRHFYDLPNDTASEEEDIGVIRTTSGRWRSARESDEHDDDEDTDFDAPILAPFKGGPVPTPRESRTDINRYGSANSQGSSQHSLKYHLPTFIPSEPLGLFGWLGPGSRGDTQNSTARSQRSQHSGASESSSRLPSDPEEGVIQGAHFARRDDASVVSTATPISSPVPLRRNDSFFRRMADAGVSAILRRGSDRSSISRSRPASQIEIRDPAPQPTLWPIVSQDQLEISEPMYPTLRDGPSSKPPVSWRAGDIAAPGQIRGQGPSLSSINTAKSMRDMVIIKREESQSTIGTTCIFDEASPSVKPRGERDDVSREVLEVMNADRRDVSSEDGGDISEYMEDDEGDITIIVIPPHMAEAKDEQTGYEGADEEDREEKAEVGRDDPFDEIEFGPNALDLSLSSSLLPVAPTSDTRPKVIPGVLAPVPEAREDESTPPSKPQSKQRDLASIASPKSPSSSAERSTSLTKTLKHVSVQPKTSPSPTKRSPLPSPYSKRRPVREVVNSINKRGSKTPTNLLAPNAVYVSSVAETAEGSKRRDAGSPSPTGSKRPTISDPFIDPFTSPTRAFPTPRSASRASRVTSPSTTFLGSPSSRKTSGIVPKTTTMWEVIKKEEKLKVANPDDER